jgi:CheY-like chemotaxis protein
MDGLEATRIIRSMVGETAGNREIPILAMTANAFEEDRQACLQAGMNDYVAKPVDPNNLYLTIVKWLPERVVDGSLKAALPDELFEIEGNIDDRPPPGFETTERPATNTDRDGFCADAPLNHEALTKFLGNDVSLHERILQEFSTHSRDIVVKFDTAWEQRDEEQVIFLTHALKSSARTVGANRLADLCVALESAGKNADWMEIDRLYPALKPAMEQMTEYIQSL